MDLSEYLQEDVPAERKSSNGGCFVICVALNPAQCLCQVLDAAGMGSLAGKMDSFFTATQVDTKNLLPTLGEFRTDRLEIPRLVATTEPMNQHDRSSWRTGRAILKEIQLLAIVKRDSMAPCLDGPEMAG